MRRSVVLAVLAAAQFLVVVSAAIVNVALPSIREGLGLTPAGMTWIVTAYVLSFGALLLLGGRVADLVGRRAVFLAGLGLFTAATVAAGLAPGAATLITARVLQGVGAAALAPAALALVTALYVTGRDRATALAVWGAVSAAGGAAGVLLGGVLTEAFGWRWVFLAEVPVAVAVLVATWWCVPATRPAPGSGVDVLGGLTVTAGLVALVLALAGGPWAPALWAAAAVLLAAFVVVERRHPAPLVPLRFFAVADVGPASVAMTVVGAVWVGLFYFLPLYQQRVLDYTPLAAALTQLPLAASNIGASWLAPRLAARYGATRTLVAGLGLLAAGLAWLGRAPVDGGFVADVLGPTLLIGTGLGLVFVQLTSAAVRGVPTDQLGLAGGLTNATRQIGGAVGLAALSAVATARTDRLAGVLDPVHALHAGYQAAFLAAAALVAVLIPLVVRSLRTSPAVPTVHR